MDEYHIINYDQVLVNNTCKIYNFLPQLFHSALNLIHLLVYSSQTHLQQLFNNR